MVGALLGYVAASRILAFVKTGPDASRESGTTANDDLAAAEKEG